MELSSSSQHGKIYQNIEVGGHTRVLFGDYIDSGSILNGRPDFTGSYAHSSLRPVASYVSRPDIERQIRERLSFDKDDEVVSNECRTVVVWGLGGAGKSQLVLDYVRACQQYYQAVFWIEAGRKETIERDYIQIYKLLFPNPTQGAKSIAVEDAISAVKSWLTRKQTQQRCLWIMDSADHVEDEESPSYIDLRHYMPSSSQLDCIVTTRSSNVQALSSEGGIAVAEMTEDEAIQLFKKQARLQQVDCVREDEIRAIVKELGCLALAVTLAASYVRETPRLASDIRQYLPEYRAQRGRILSRKAHRHTHQYNESVFGTWEVSFAAVEHQSPMAAKLLCLLGCVNSDDIFLDLFKVVAATQSPNDEMKDTDGNEWWCALSAPETVVDEYEIEAAFGLLQTYSLVSWRSDQASYSMHKLVHAWTYDRLAKPRRRSWTSIALELLRRFASGQKDYLRTNIRVVPHIMAAFAAFSVASGPDDCTSSRQLKSIELLGDILFDLGQYNHAFLLKKFLLRTLEGTQRLDHPDTLKSMYTVATTLDRQGQYEQAEALLIQTVELRKRVLGLEHPATMMTLLSQAVVLSRHGKYGHAEEIYRQTLEVVRRNMMNSSSEHPDTLIGMCQFVNLLDLQGKYREAEEIIEEIFAHMKRVLGPEHPETLFMLSMQARIMYRQGKIPEAERLLVQVLALQEKVIGPEHPNVLTTRHDLACALLQQGKLAQAERLCSHTIELYKKVLGPEHPETLSSMHILATLLCDQGKWQLAMDMGHNLVQMAQKVLGSDDITTLCSMDCLSRVLQAQGQYASAESMMREVLDRTKIWHGLGHPHTLVRMYKLASILEEQGNFKEAEQLYRQAANAAKAGLGPRHPTTIKLIANIAWNAHRRGSCEYAEALFRHLIILSEDVLGPSHLDTLEIINMLALVLRQQEKYAESEWMHRQIFGLRKSLLGPRHPKTLTSMSSLAVTLSDKGDRAEAEILIREVLVSRREILGIAHPDTLWIMESLAIVLSNQGKEDEAQNLRRQVLELKIKALDLECPNTLEEEAGQSCPSTK